MHSTCIGSYGLVKYLLFNFSGTKTSLLGYFDSEPTETTDEKKKSNVQQLPEIDVYLHLLTIIYFIDNALLDKV